MRSQANAEAVVLLDNATLRAAARAFGLEPIGMIDRAVFDVDIAAASLLVDAMIVFDKVYLLDTPSCRQIILKHPIFASPPFELLTIPSEIIKELDDKAMLNAATLNFRHSHELDDLLQATGIYLGWRGSETNSNLKIILQYLGIKDVFASQLIDEVRQLREGQLEDEKSANPRYLELLRGMDCLTREEDRRFITNLSWIVARTRFYQAVTSVLGIPYKPHQLRARFLQFNVMADEAAALRESGNSRTQTSETIAEFIRKTRDQIYEEASAVFDFRVPTLSIPPFFVYTLEHSAHASDVLPTAVEIRNSSGAKDLRKMLQEVECAVDKREIGVIIKVQKRLQELSVRIKREFGASSRTVDIENKWTLVVSTVKLPTWHIEIPPFLERQIFFRNSYLAFIRDVTCDLTRVSSLGGLYDRIFKDVLRTQGF